ncbi:MAG: ATP-binding protein [Actinobacteria bacterium]|nr:ATP-binding protein [Actinomycetota bacterium]
MIMQRSLQAKANIVKNYLDRELSGQIARALRSLPTVVLTGMRQVGKTSMLVNDPELSKREYVSLDDMAYLKALEENTDQTLSYHDAVTIDEAQRSDTLFMGIKRVLEKDRRPGRFLLSGSATLPLKKAAAETLTGRSINLKMMPMTRREIREETGGKPFILKFFSKPGKRNAGEVEPITDAEVMTGGLPPVVLAKKEDARFWLIGYEQNYLERDIRFISRVNNIIGFSNLVRLVAGRTGQLLNVSNIGRDADLNYNTTMRYLGWLEDLFLIYRVQAFRGSRASRIRKKPKVFFADSGLACHLAGIEDLSRDPLKGYIYETFVAQNLLGILEAHTLGWELFYWKTAGEREVDFVVDNRREVVGIEVKASSSFGSSDIRNLRAFLEATPNARAGILAYNGTEMVSLGRKIWAVPISVLLS